MKHKRLSALLVALLVVVATRAPGAHHSAAMFDHDRVVEISGVVKEFQWTNPHVWIQLDVEGAGNAGNAGNDSDDSEDSEDSVVEWSIEGGGPNSLSRQGWRPSTFPPGAAVTLRINPMLDGTPAGGFVGAQFDDGSTLGRWE